MTLIISKADADKAHHALLAIFDSFLAPRTAGIDHNAIINHLVWMQHQPEMFVNCRFETFPLSKVTKITLEISHTPIPPLKPR